MTDYVAYSMRVDAVCAAMGWTHRVTYKHSMMSVVRIDPHGTTWEVAPVILESLEKIIAQRDAALAGPDKTIRCAFCGHAYPDGTPTHKHQLLTEHARVCPEHPLGKENRELRAALKQIAFDVIGAPEATHRQMVDGMTEIARDALAKTGGAS